MDDFILVERIEALKQRMCKFAYQLQTESVEAILLDQFIQINIEQFESDAHVIAKSKVVVHMDDIHRVVLVLFP